MEDRWLEDAKSWLRGPSWGHRVAWAGVVVVDLFATVLMLRAML